VEKPPGRRGARRPVTTGPPWGAGR